MRTIVKNCLECNKKISFIFKGDGIPHGRKFCSKYCSSRYFQKKLRVKINAAARQRLIDNPIKERARRAEFAKKWRAKNIDKVRQDSRKRKETGIGEPVLFYGYKEPLTKFKGGHGYNGVLSYSKDRDKIQCHFCGKLFRSINNGHLMKVHGLTASEYKEKTQLSLSASLVGEGTRQKLLDRPYNPNHMQELKKVWEKRREIIKSTGQDPQKHHKISLEIKNKRGTCPDQLLDIIEKTVKSYGRTMTQEEFLKFHAGKYLGSIRNTYGTWTNALAKLGLRTNKTPDHTRESLLGEMKNFYRVHKRTPRWSDFQRGLLPDANAYYRQFKGLNHARLLAGLPIIMNVGRQRKEWKPTKIESQKMIDNFEK